MISNFLNSRTQDLLHKAMDASSLRHDVISNNLANIDTPQFKRGEVIFEEKLKDIMQKKTSSFKLKTSNFRHIQIEGSNKNLDKINPSIKIIDNLSYRNDGNNVDIDVETAKMTKNKIVYDALAQSYNKEVRLLRMAITGRG